MIRLFPETVLPVQFLFQRGVLGGARRLCHAVLMDALLLAQRPGVPPERRLGRPRHPTPADEARAWLASDERGYVFSFLALCELFDLDPAQVRAAVGRFPPARRYRSRLAGFGYRQPTERRTRAA